MSGFTDWLRWMQADQFRLADAEQRLAEGLAAWDEAADGDSMDAEYEAGAELADIARTVLAMARERRKGHAMTTELAAKIDVRGIKVTVSVDEDGRFMARLAGETYRSDTLAGLKTILMTESRKAAAGVTVPFTLLDHSKIQHGAATGVHATRRVVLVRWEDGRTGELYAYSASTMRRLEGGQAEDLRQLVADRDRAIKAVDDFVVRYRFDVREALTREQQKAVGDVE